MPLGMKVGLGGDIVLDGDPAPLLKRGQSSPPQFSAHVYCGQTAGWINMTLGTKVGLGPGHVVLAGYRAPFPQKGTETRFLAHVYCGQMAPWIKIPFGMEVGLGLRDIVLDGDPAPPSPKGAQSPNFWSMSFVAKWLCGLRWHLVWR